MTDEMTINEHKGFGMGVAVSKGSIRIQSCIKIKERKLEHVVVFGQWNKHSIYIRFAEMPEPLKRKLVRRVFHEKPLNRSIPPVLYCCA